MTNKDDIPVDGIEQLRKAESLTQSRAQYVLSVILRISGAAVLATAGAIVATRTAIDTYKHISHFIFEASHGYLADRSLAAWGMEASVIGIIVAQALLAVLCFTLAHALFYLRWSPKKNRWVPIIFFTGLVLYIVSFLAFATIYGYGMKDFN